MKKNIQPVKRILMLLFLIILCNEIIAQNLSYVQEGIVQTKENLSLKGFLISFEQRNGIKFAYDEELISGKYISYPDTNNNKDPETTLQNVLNPLQLAFKRIDEKHYVIRSKDILQKAEKLNSSLSSSTGTSFEKFILSKKNDFFISTRKVEKIITGTVKNNEGAPVPGVTVQVKGTNRGTVTDIDGKYSINVPDENATLVFSFIGYLTREVDVREMALVNITLIEDTKQLDEVVVIGYGEEQRVNVIGSISQVSAEEINDRATPQLRQALTGQIPGVTIIQRSGQPGAPGGSIQIRGVGSFGAGTDPLILVDGMPVNSMNDIDPKVIAKVSVLKDASSAAIYGSRAANGVILITTKMGESNKVNITYNGYYGIQKPTAFPEFVDSWEYATLLNEATGSSGGYTDEEIQKFKDGTDPDNYPNINYLDAIVKDHSVQTGHNVTISNSNKTSQYLLSMGYLYQDGIIAENDYNRYNLRLNLKTDLTSDLKLTARLSSIHVQDRQPNSPANVSTGAKGILGIIGRALRNPPIHPAKLSNGDYGLGVAGTGTPVSFIESDGFYKNKTTDLNGNLRLDWHVIPSLKFSLIGGYTQLNGRSDTFLATQRLNANVFLGPSTLNVRNVFNNYKTFQQLVEYNNEFGQHNLSVLAAHSFEEFFTENTSASRIDFPSNDIVVIDAGSADNQTNGGSAREYALESYFGRVKYNYANRYLVEGVLRYDGSSRFPTDNKYAFFPSAAVGWRISEENFLKNRFSFLDELKLKASYGVLGNQSIGNYPYQNIFQGGFNYGFGNTVNTGVANTTLIDPTIHWESTRTYDIGLETGFWNGKLAFNATYYNRYTYDILVAPNASVSDVLGFDVGQTNSGALENRGWEFMVKHQNTVGNLQYSISGNFSVVNNEVLDLGVANVKQPNGMVGNGSSLFIGYPLNAYYGYLTDGLYVDTRDVENYMENSDQSAINPAPQPGDVKYKDISGPNGLPDGQVDPTYDRVILGSRIPKYSYGLNLGAKYKGFSLSALLQAVSGVKSTLTYKSAAYAFGFKDGNVQRWQMEERWTEENPNPKATYPRIETVPNSGTPNTVLSDYWVLNASYIKLRNLQLAYSLPKSLMNKMGIENLRLSLSAENLWTISSYREGWDPEINAGFRDYYPILTNYTFGILANFK